MSEYSIWPSTNGPLASSEDTGAVNLGIEFYVTQPCWFKAIRFFAPSTGYTSSLTRRVGLYRVADANSGYFIEAWNQTDPVVNGAWNRVEHPGAMIPLLANTRYRAVVHHYAGGYASTSHYFDTGDGSSGLTNGPLVCPSAANAVGNAQGQYGYLDAIYYTQEYFNAGNYWTDVVVSDVGPPISATGELSTPLSTIKASGTVADGGVTPPPSGQKFYVGDSPVSAIYLGSNRWWSAS